MRKVFLDCGTNLCQGLNQISNENKIDDTWVVYSFDVKYNIDNKNSSIYINKINEKNIKYTQWY